MKKFIYFSILLFVGLPFLHAQNTLFQEKGCAVCHGKNAQGIKNLSAPALAGLEASYVVRQLQNFKNANRGYHKMDRNGKTMVGSVQILSETDMQKIADYLYSLDPIKHKATVPGNPLKGKALYAVCASCHGENGEGNTLLNAPALNGLQDWYVASQITQFKRGYRGGSLEKEPFAASMVPMAGLLANKKAIYDVSVYILSLKKIKQGAAE